ncbi:MAG: hypothetical protein ACOC7T_00925 [Planctomycetota bacterium]
MAGMSMIVLALVLFCVLGGALVAESAKSLYAAWENGPPDEADFFPIAVWLQDPELAPRYAEAGVNTYVALRAGPTDEQLDQLRKAGIKAVCAQNEKGLAHIEDPTIVAWMHGDEPDNAQPLPEAEGYGEPVPPEQVVARYERMKERDPTRPVLLNLGQGVAWDGWAGRGSRSGHPEDYPHYVKACDIASFDIYPVAHPSDDVRDKLWYVANGVQRLNGWTGEDQPVWNCLEVSRIKTGHRPSPEQLRAEAWMALIHGSKGLIYFVHEWQPKFSAHALLDDPELLPAATALNEQIHRLAPVLNAPDAEGEVEAAAANPQVPIATMVKRWEDATYVFAVAMREAPTGAEFTLREASGGSVEVLGEDRDLQASAGTFSDRFGPYGVHLYRIE